MAFDMLQETAVSSEEEEEEEEDEGDGMYESQVRPNLALHYYGHNNNIM